MLQGGQPRTDSNGERVFVLRDASFDYARLRMGQELLEAGGFDVWMVHLG